MTSALTQHKQSFHKNLKDDIGIYDIEILSKKRNPRETTIEEARHIESLKPAINRKQELTFYPLITNLTT